MHHIQSIRTSWFDCKNFVFLPWYLPHCWAAKQTSLVAKFCISTIIPSTLAGSKNRNATSHANPPAIATILYSESCGFFMNRDLKETMWVTDFWIETCTMYSVMLFCTVAQTFCVWSDRWIYTLVLQFMNCVPHFNKIKKWRISTPIDTDKIGCCCIYITSSNIQLLVIYKNYVEASNVQRRQSTYVEKVARTHIEMLDR